MQNKHAMQEGEEMKNNFYNPERWRSTSLWYRFIHEVHPAKTAERTRDAGGLAMGRLIDEQELLETLEEFIEYDPFDVYKEEPILNISFEQMEDIIAQIPTAKQCEKKHGFFQKVLNKKKRR